EKIEISLNAFKVYYVLEGPPVGEMTEEEQRKREQDETLCRGYILSTLTDRLYDLYTPMASAREIWNSLEEKYTAEKEGADKFITFKFFEFAMEDNVLETTKAIQEEEGYKEFIPEITRKTRNHCLRLCVTNVVKKGISNATARIPR
ncbi:hypothetical protein Tco_0233300, partial [Tanacetum coccineum]